MSSKINVEGYFQTIHAPWGQLFYRLVFNHLDFTHKKVLDYGSGFGITAEYLSAQNEVLAIEPSKDMLSYREEHNHYKQIYGGFEELQKIPTASMDVIICHNVMEYLDDREEVFREFHRILRPDGIISLIKHNKAGKIMQKVVFENKVEDAISLIHDGQAISANFGVIKEYEIAELQNYIKGLFEIQNIYGIRTFFALQSNDLKGAPDWADRMYAIETEAEEIPVFRDVAFFHHIFLRKRS